MDRKQRRDKRFVERRSYDIKQLWEHHHTILRMVALGMSNKEIADTVGCTPQTVSNVRNSPMAQGVLDQHREKLDEEVVTMAERINRFAPTALALLEDIIDGRRDAPMGLQAKTAENYLARAGYGPVHKAVNLSQHLTREDIERIKERAAAAQNESAAMEAEYSAIP
jgi:DNA-binding transcriptional MerR regulator